MQGFLRLQGKDISRIQRILDPILVTLLFLVIVPQPSSVWWQHSWLWVAGTSFVLLPRNGIYNSYRQKSLFSLFRRVIRAWLVVLTALLLLSFFTKTSADYSRLASALWAASSCVVLLINHVWLRKLLRVYRSRGGNLRTIVYWGLPEAAIAFADQLDSQPWMGLKMIAWFSPEHVVPDSALYSSLPTCGGSVLEMRQWLRTNQVDRIVFSHVTREGMAMQDMIELFGDTAVPVVYAPHWAKANMRFSVDDIGDQRCINLWGQETSIFDRQLKRLLDLILTFIGVIVISPVLAGVALAVKLSSPGPIFFLQDRYGLDGRRFRCIKFRSMSVMEPGDSSGLIQAKQHDPRVTPVGRFLRRWSLDELPQLFNVLKGDMSLVGPRPHATDHNEQYRKLIPGYMQRHSFKPGMTGLAQVEGWRGETRNLIEMVKRVDADLRYQRDWSIKLDIKILFRTFFKIRSGNAY